MAALSFALALTLRVGDDVLDTYRPLLIQGPLVFAPLAAIVFRLMGMYRGVWRYASVDDAAAITKGAALAILIFLPVMFALTRLEGFPRSLPLIQWFVLVALLGGPRFLFRLLKDRRALGKLAAGGDSRVPVLLIGAGDEAELFIRATGHPHADYRAVAMVDDKNSRVGRVIHGIGVLGTLDGLRGVLDQLDERGERPQRLVVASPSLGGAEMRGLLDLADSLGMTLSRLPRLTDFRSLDEPIPMRPIALEDLLGRPQTVLGREDVETLVRGRRVLVTGAGGSIGGELARQIAAIGPARLVLADSCEYALYTIDLEIHERHPGVPRRAVICDVRDAGRLAQVMGEERPQLVFHAAALKHVPMVEENPVEGVLTNAIGSRNVADCCQAHGVEAMVLISTDKAVNPSNVMGATKRIAESYCQALDVEGGGTRFVTVRFGNVLGSTGSVVPLFQRQLAAGGPLTVTHPEITRFFMTVREAVELVLHASALAAGSPEHGKIYVLDMGEPVRIVDLARQMIRLAGQDVRIEFTGLRPGEKLYEEIFHGAEPALPTALQGVLIAAPRAADHAVLAAALDALETQARAGRTQAVLDGVRRLVPEWDSPRALLDAPSSCYTPAALPLPEDRTP
ncbi:MAG: polysaccharide biosynthesis protein [Alphaproteobacteria bacterium]|nr:polysaccharide biosynthesis protein [Alphaproteobacteria bacterium]